MEGAQIMVFGANETDQLGIHPDHEKWGPEKKHGFPLTFFEENKIEVSMLRCGASHALALDSEGRVWSWGMEDDGVLGRVTEDG